MSLNLFIFRKHVGSKLGHLIAENASSLMHVHDNFNYMLTFIAPIFIATLDILFMPACFDQALQFSCIILCKKNVYPAGGEVKICISSRQTKSISWMLMPWLLASPGHQLLQPWYWLTLQGELVLCSIRNGFNNLHCCKFQCWEIMEIANPIQQ